MTFARDVNSVRLAIFILACGGVLAFASISASRTTSWVTPLPTFGSDALEQSNRYLLASQINVLYAECQNAGDSLRARVFRHIFPAGLGQIEDTLDVVVFELASSAQIGRIAGVQQATTVNTGVEP